MKRTTLFLLVVAVSLAAACSKSPPEATAGKPEAAAAAAGKTETAATQADYKKICERLVPLALEAHRESLTQANCETKYQSYLHTCRNGAALTDCFMKIKSWDERLACIDSCVRDTVPAK